jgi:N-formylglutamate amidohydrolase
MAELFTLQRGDAPLIVNVPHAGTVIPDEMAASMTEQGRAVPDTDWHVEALYDFVPATGATLMVATHSRFVVDLNRDPSGAALYPGASNTEVCPTTTFHDEPVYRQGRAPATNAVADRIERYWRPYHTSLQAEIDRIRSRHGFCILLDGHSIVSEAPRFFAGRLPDLNLGTAEGASCAPSLQTQAMAILSADAALTSVCNGRFKGGYITRHFGRPVLGQHALQLEMAQACYMDEHHRLPFDRRRAAALTELLRRLVDRLLAWTPSIGGETQKSL